PRSTLFPYTTLFRSPWRLDAFLTIENHMSDPAYWSLLGHVWLDCEDPHQRLRHWLRLWQSSRPHQELVMDEEERKALDALPDRLDRKSTRLNSSHLG